MALDLTPEQKAIGRKNFEQAAGDLERLATEKKLAGAPDRRTFMKSALAGAAVVPVSAAVYFGYESWEGNKPVRTALIGCGDEGGVLIGDHNPAFNEIVAVCDIRPSNMKRIFDGDTGPRKGLKKVYGEATANKIAKYDNLSALLADKSKLGLEAVVVATPLNTHDVITKACMDAGLHVLCEKLMARNITKCKGMIKYAKDKKLLLSIGHQRHYSMLYAHALEVVNTDILGDIKHIRALWHRNNSFLFSATDAEKAKFAPQFDIPYYRDGWCKPILKEDADALPPEKLRELAFGNVKEYGFEDAKELVRWRLYDKTGGGLMAELGSHQLDASSLILGHVHPLAVSGVGGKFFYGPGRNDRESDDGVFVTFEFPGKKHPKAGKGGTDESDIVVVTYSSFNTNSFEKYGECVMGSRGTMVIEEEKDVFLFKEPEPGKKDSGGRDTNVTVTSADGKKPAMEASSTWGGGGGAAISKAPGAPAWDSAVRGYRTEMEHFAYCVRKWDGKIGWEKKDGKFVQEVPRCHGEVAMADAILALTANMAMKKRQRIEFEHGWFDADSPDAPETKYGSEGRA
ncbi:Gfo/Idh/MocA family protein [Fimbriiglobus ruber]|uniref:Putative NADH-dependent dehydrogenase n=1 Tax=Fimbriiglobus ruber TaxID=1908690 RepID=A0A225DGC1_9BACT|nr:Gfo/Idh/MocA family oxidoreductase [Fimbriiglobus ruber]OWK36229.1 putative NADH-dependent dehydrogenase [Fimbriiglobus ruber]